MQKILNIAGYKFIRIDRLHELRDQLKKICQDNAIKGTILLASEGININVAGSPDNIDKILLALQRDERFKDIEFKKSYSDFIPFKRLLIKIKREIITFGVAEVEPEKLTSKKLSPKQFKEWLDQKKDILILDTRNCFEVEMGKFTNAVDLNIKHFREFPHAIQKLSPEKHKTIVMYCTGGIRCEKASAYMMQQGFQDVYQLHGGILQYFVECNNAHYDGKCFVFDDRVQLNDASSLRGALATKQSRKLLS